MSDIITKIKEEIEKLREKESNTSFVPLDLGKEQLYVADVWDLISALECAVEALEEYSDLHYAPKLEEALNKIQEKIKG